MLFLIYLLLISVAAIIFLILFFISSIVSSGHGVPLVSTQRKNIKALLAWGGLSASDIFYDLGCGDGRVLISAVRDFGVKKAVGYEIAPWPLLEASFSLWQSRLNRHIKIFRKNFFQADLSNASFIYAYLFPGLIDRLAYKLAEELPSGAKILCPSFPIDLTRQNFWTGAKGAKAEGMSKNLGGRAKHPEFKLLKSQKIGKITAHLYELVSK